MAVTLKDVDRITHLKNLSNDFTVRGKREFAPLYVRLIDKGACDDTVKESCTDRIMVLSEQAYLMRFLYLSSYTPTSGIELARRYKDVKALANNMASLLRPFCSREVETPGGEFLREDLNCYTASFAILLDMLDSEKDIDAALKEGSSFRENALDSIKTYFGISGTILKFTDIPEASRD